MKNYTDFTTIQVNDNNNIVEILFDRPKKRHSINPLLAKELLSVLTDISESKDVRVVIISSTDEYFCSGADLEAGLGDYNDSEEILLQMYWPILEKISNMPQIVIAAIPGVTAGIGCALVLAADMIIMHPKASLYFAFIKIGLIADGGAHWQLLSRLSYQKAFELLIEGGALSANECYDYGIANKLDDNPLTAAREWSTSLSQLAPIAVQHTKSCLRKMHTANFQEAIQIEAASQKICESSDDAKEGIMAFLQKRKPNFVGQ
jgi:2-(1,2-epoxy-1,2-dihydrophenyl)acetyl-CoA isomerase